MDTDRDGLDDLAENDLDTDPLKNDSDNDGLLDLSEINLDTDPWNSDSDNDSVSDGLEIYTSMVVNEELGVRITVTGVGDCSQNTRLARETSAFYTNHSALVSPLVNIVTDGMFESANVTFSYDPALIVDPGNVSVCYLNETLGVYLPLDTVVDLTGHTFTAVTSHFSLYGAFYTPELALSYGAIDELNGGYDSIIELTDVNVRNYVDITVVDGGSTYTNSVDVFPDTRSSIKPYVYVSDYYQNSIYVVDTESRSIVYTIHTDHGPGELALSHDGSRLYAGSNDRVMIIDTRTNTVIDSIPVANGAARIELSPDDKKLYVATDFTSTRIAPSGYIAVYDIQSKTRTGTIGEVPNIGAWQ